MKRWMMMGAALVLALSLGTAGVVAASPWCRGGQGSCDGSACAWVDADGDGLCDHRSCRHADANGDGICDNCACAWVDADRDGLCDNAGTCAGGQHHGGWGHHGRR